MLYIALWSENSLSFCWRHCSFDIVLKCCLKLYPWDPVWYVYLDLVDFMVNVGKYTSHMDALFGYSTCHISIFTPSMPSVDL